MIFYEAMIMLEYVFIWRYLAYSLFLIIISLKVAQFHYITISSLWRFSKFDYLVLWSKIVVMWLKLMYIGMIFNIRLVFGMWNEACEFWCIMSCESLDYLKFMFSSWLSVILYGNELLVKSLFLEVFREWQVSLEDECCPSGKECKTPKVTYVK